jgi:hypothetical protein
MMNMKTFLFRTAMLMLSLLVLTTNVEAKKKKYPNGDVYVGKWKKGAPEGQGKLTRANGERYEGMWHMGFLTEGEAYMTNGIVYKGTWSDEMHAFRGSITNASADIYEGEGQWEDWYYQNGKGKISYASGGVYTGEWKKLKKHGQGNLIDASGNRYEGVWDMDRLTEGSCLHSDGMKENGTWAHSALQNGTREYKKGDIQYVETISSGSIIETKQILPSGTEYWPDSQKMNFKVGMSNVTVNGLASRGKLKISFVDYYDVDCQSDSIVFTGEGLDRFAIAKGTPQEIDTQLINYCTAHLTTMQQQYSEQKEKEERELREQLAAERRAEEARQKIYYDMVVGQTYKTDDANAGDVGATLLFGSMGSKLAYTFHFKSREEVDVTSHMDIPASLIRRSPELLILVSEMNKSYTRRYEVKDGEIIILDKDGKETAYKASIENNGGYLDFNKGLSCSVINVKGNRPTVKSVPAKSRKGWAGRRYRSDKVIFANQNLAKQYDSDMFTIVPTFTIQFDSDTQATVLTTVELKKKPYVNLSQEQWDLLTKQAQQKVTSRTQTYTITGSRMKMGAETFRIVSGGQSLVNDSPDFKGTVLRRIE